MKMIFKRLLAAVIDMYINCFISSVVVLVVTLGKMNVTLFSIFSYLTTFFILSFLKDFIFANQSIGKKIFRIVIIKNDSTKLNLKDVFKRTVTLALLPLEVLLLIFAENRLGDVWAQTSVVDITQDNTGDGSMS